MRVEDDIVARISLCTLTQAVNCTPTSRTSVEAVIIRRWVPAPRGNGRGRRGGGAGTSSGGWASARTLGLVVDLQVGITAVRITLALVEGFAGVQPARPVAQVRVVGGEDDKVARRVGVTVPPA